MLQWSINFSYLRSNEKCMKRIDYPNFTSGLVALLLTFVFLFSGSTGILILTTGLGIDKIYT